MADKFRGKYRIPSARLQSWDYGSNAPYFVTICTQGMVHHFGKIIKGKMHKNKVGLIAEKYWHEIPKHFPFVLLDAFTVMPNHIHGIVIINKPATPPTSKSSEIHQEKPKTEQHSEIQKTDYNSNELQQNDNSSDTSQNNLGSEKDILDTRNQASLPNSGGINSDREKIGGKNPKWKPGTLGVILNQYKRICTINMRKHHPDFDWKERYYDHIIRNIESFYTIRNYILHNPENWDKDKFYNE